MLALAGAACHKRQQRTALALCDASSRQHRADDILDSTVGAAWHWDGAAFQGLSQTLVFKASGYHRRSAHRALPVGAAGNNWIPGLGLRHHPQRHRRRHGRAARNRGAALPHQSRPRGPGRQPHPARGPHSTPGARGPDRARATASRRSAARGKCATVTPPRRWSTSIAARSRAAPNRAARMRPSPSRAGRRPGGRSQEIGAGRKDWYG